jgi:hypothetical protein
MEGLKSDMAEHGLDHPLTVRVDPESGAMNLVDGNHRVVAARELGWGSVPVVVERGRGGGRVRPSQVGVPTAVARTVVGETAPTLDAFTEMAGRGKLHEAKGSTRIEWRTTAALEAQADTPFEMGVINGYSEDDIAHFYLALRSPWNKARTAKNVGAVRDDMRELAYEQFLEDRAEYLAKQSGAPLGSVHRQLSDEIGEVKVIRDEAGEIGLQVDDAEAFEAALKSWEEANQNIPFDPLDVEVWDEGFLDIPGEAGFPAPGDAYIMVKGKATPVDEVTEVQLFQEWVELHGVESLQDLAQREMYLIQVFRIYF